MNLLLFLTVSSLFLFILPLSSFLQEKINAQPRSILMGMYEFDEKERAALERLGIAMAIYQLVDKRVTALLVTDGMCKLMDKDRLM